MSRFIWCTTLLLAATARDESASADEAPRVLDVRVTLSPDAISSSNSPRHDPRFCIHPPPFGDQCTMHANDALGACAVLDGCVGLVCPDPTPYRRGVPRKRIRGPICQARGHMVSDERNHSMCKPGGCAHVRVEKSGGGGVVNARLPPPETLPPFLRGAWSQFPRPNDGVTRVPLPPTHEKGVRPRRVVDALNSS
jgi:hypothetical protein